MPDKPRFQVPGQRPLVVAALSPRRRCFHSNADCLPIARHRWLHQDLLFLLLEDESQDHKEENAIDAYDETIMHSQS